MKKTSPHTPRHTSKEHAPNHSNRECLLCPRAKQCGACPQITIPYPKQLHAKQAYLNELFQELYNPHTHIYTLAGMDDPTHYRNKVISPFAYASKPSHAARNKTKQTQIKRRTTQQNKRDKKDASHASQPEILTGMYARGTHRLINTDDCLVENETANTIVQAVRALMIRYHMEPYCEDTGEGFMRHVVIRVGHTSNEVLVTLVTNKEEFRGAKNFCRELVTRVPAITTIVQNVNTRQTNVILGDGHERTLYGPGFILDSLCGVSFRISSHSFYQVNATQTEVLYKRAIEMAHLSQGDQIIDAYCGTGTIGLAAAAFLENADNSTDKLVQNSPDSCACHPTPQHKTILTSKQARRKTSILGVDSVAAAIKDARENARHNNITSAEFVCADAGVYLQRLARQKQSIDVVFMDPPRAGSSREFLEALISLKPRRIVYISCNPKTQKRDAEILCSAGYTITEAQGVDMFPHTDHIEHIITLELN